MIMMIIIERIEYIKLWRGLRAWCRLYTTSNL